MLWWCRNLQLYRLLLPIFPPEVLGKAGSGAELWCGGAVGADPVLKWWCCCGEAAVATLSTASTAPLQVVSTRAHPGTYLSSCPWPEETSSLPSSRHSDINTAQWWLQNTIPTNDPQLRSGFRRTGANATIRTDEKYKIKSELCPVPAYQWNVSGNLNQNDVIFKTWNKPRSQLWTIQNFSHHPV